MSSKGWEGNYFEDFELEKAWTCPVARRLGDGEIASYVALTGDRSARYCDARAMVHPLITFHLVLGQTVREISLNARANLGYAGMRWGAPVFAGDTITTSVRIVGLKENSNRRTGIVWVRTEASNQKGDEVLSYWRWVMVRKRAETPTAWLDEPRTPELPSLVEPDALHVPSDVDPGISGGRWAFEDYAEGERVLHHDGQTVNASDHMSFTRLFQNSAKVHFDALRTGGEPLVYGGVPISLGYAQAFNGFENRLGIAAINAGAHTNPLHAGDTVYSFTDVLDTRLLNPQVGALRLRLVALKNLDPATQESFRVEVEDAKRPGRTRAHDAVILDLDYWELMPTREALTALGRQPGGS